MTTPFPYRVRRAADGLEIVPRRGAEPIMGRPAVLGCLAIAAAGCLSIPGIELRTVAWALAAYGLLATLEWWIARRLDGKPLWIADDRTIYYDGRTVDDGSLPCRVRIVELQFRSLPSAYGVELIRANARPIELPHPFYFCDSPGQAVTLAMAVAGGLRTEILPETILREMYPPYAERMVALEWAA